MSATHVDASSANSLPQPTLGTHTVRIHYTHIHVAMHTMTHAIGCTSSAGGLKIHYSYHDDGTRLPIGTRSHFRTRHERRTAPSYKQHPGQMSCIGRCPCRGMDVALRL